MAIAALFGDQQRHNDALGKMVTLENRDSPLEVGPFGGASCKTLTPTATPSEASNDEPTSIETCQAAWEDSVDSDDVAAPFSPSKSAKRRLRRRRQMEAVRSAGDSNLAMAQGNFSSSRAPAQLRSVVNLTDIGIGAFGEPKNSQAATSALSAVTGIASPCRTRFARDAYMNSGCGVNHGLKSRAGTPIVPLAFAPTSPIHLHHGALFVSTSPCSAPDMPCIGDASTRSPQAGDASARSPPSYWLARRCGVASAMTPLSGIGSPVVATTPMNAVASPTEATLRLLIGASTPQDLVARLKVAARDIYED